MIVIRPKQFGGAEQGQVGLGGHLGAHLGEQSQRLRVHAVEGIVIKRIGGEGHG